MFNFEFWCGLEVQENLVLCFKDKIFICKYLYFHFKNKKENIVFNVILKLLYYFKT